MKKQKKQIKKSSAKKTVEGAKALFWYLTLFFTLGITAFSTGGLWFQFINKWFLQEVLSGQVVNPFSQTVLKMQLAALIVAVPLFFFASLTIRRALKNGSLPAENKVRLWITYIILFIAVAVATGDLITATFRLLNGDYTARFLLKCLDILVIVSWVFSYYWLELKSPKTLNHSPLPKIMGLISLVVIIISFIGTLFIMESPMEAKRKAFDRTRANDLQTIKYTIDDYYREYQKLPASLEELKNTRSATINDPKASRIYEYQITGQNAYRLCAEFDTDNKTIGEKDAEYYMMGGEFLHSAGRNCFDRQVSLTYKEIPDQPTVIPEPVPVK